MLLLYYPHVEAEAFLGVNIGKQVHTTRATQFPIVPDSRKLASGVSGYRKLRRTTAEEGPGLLDPGHLHLLKRPSRFPLPSSLS